MNTPFSPRPALQHLPDSSFSGSLEENPLDSSFNFMSDTPLDYFIASPDAQGEQQGHMSHIHPPQHEQYEGQVDAPPSSATFPMSNLSLGDGSDQSSQATIQPYSQPPTFVQYPVPIPMPAQPQHHHSHSFSGGYHPYRPYALRSNRLSRSPDARPTSPPLSLSPPGSSHGPVGHNNSPSAVSPSLVSPMSIAGGNISDTSPQHWGYSLASQSIYTGTPLTSVTTLSNVSPPAGAMMNMVGGFPFPTPPGGTSPAKRGPPPMRPRMRNRAQTMEAVKKEKEDEEGDLSDAEGEDEFPTAGGASGLGLNPEDNSAENRVPVLGKADIRKARIESEQRRRDELRQGFNRLRETLPPSNQRASKSSLLDRSVAHIQSIEAANRYLMTQLETAQMELAKLRATNAELVHAVAVSTRAGSGSSPGSTGR